MKTIITLDKANQPYGYPQLDGSGSLQATGSLFGTASYALTASYAMNGGGGTPVVPCFEDFRIINSYGRWCLGNYLFGPLNDEDKFTALANEYDPTDYLTLQFHSAVINGRSVSICPTQSITVTSTNLVYRDDGLGMAPVNYIDFINGIFANQNLYTTLTGSSGLNFQANFCKTDQFILILKETGKITTGSTPIQFPFYYGLITDIWNTTIQDTFGSGFPLNPNPSYWV